MKTGSGFEEGTDTLTGLVALRYAWNVETGQRTELPGKVAMKTFGISLADPLLRGDVREKHTPSGRTLQNLRSSLHNEETRSGQLSAKSIANFIERSFKDSFEDFPRDDRNLVTMETSHVEEYLGIGGLILSIPLRSWQTIGC